MYRTFLADPKVVNPNVRLVGLTDRSMIQFVRKPKPGHYTLRKKVTSTARNRRGAMMQGLCRDFAGTLSSMSLHRIEKSP